MLRIKRLLPLLLVTLAIAAAALAANLLVLDRAGASGDDLGSLSPVQPALTTPATTPTTTAPPSTLPPTTGDGQHHDSKDHGRDHADHDD